MLDILNSQEEEKIGTELLFLQEPLGVLGHVLTVLSHPNALSEHRELYILGVMLLTGSYGLVLPGDEALANLVPIVLPSVNI